MQSNGSRSKHIAPFFSQEMHFPHAFVHITDRLLMHHQTAEAIGSITRNACKRILSKHSVTGFKMFKQAEIDKRLFTRIATTSWRQFEHTSAAGIFVWSGQIIVACPTRSVCHSVKEPQKITFEFLRDSK